MTNERKQLIQSLFCEVLEREDFARDRSSVDSFLEQRCGDDVELRNSVLRLLDRDRDLERSTFLEQSPTNLPLAKTTKETLLGKQLGAFRLTRLLGSGGMGDVYLGVRDEDFQQQAAIKVIRSSGDGDKMARRFRQEMQFLATLGKHPSITNILDAGTTESGQLFIAMEYVDGQQINAYCDAQRLGIRERLQLFCEACNAVQFAHQNAVLHRDLKPSNLLVTQAGEPKLIDFGVAKLTENPYQLGSDCTKTQNQPFTPGYSSPEQIKGEPATTASDVYALGAILYELLSGHQPHPLAGRSLADCVHLVCDSEPTRPSTAVTNAVRTCSNDDDNTESKDSPLLTPTDLADLRRLGANRLSLALRGDLDRIVMKAIDRDVTQRYATVEQLTEDIRCYLSGYPVKARRGSSLYRLRKYVRRNAWGVTLASAFVLTLIGGVAVTSRLALFAERSAAAEREQRLIAADSAKAEREQRLEAARLAKLEQEQRLLAERREQTASDIAEMFDNFLASADPRVSGKKDTTSRELIETFAKELESKSVEDPLVKARFLQTIASAYIGMGDYGVARRNATRAVDLLKSSLGKGDLATAKAMVQNARIYLLWADFEKAETELREVLALDGSSPSNRVEWHSLQFSALKSLADAEMRLGDYDAATKTLERASKLLQEKLPDSTHEEHELAGLRNYLLLRQGKFEEALPFTKGEYERSLAEYGANDYRTANDGDALAAICMNTDRFDEAIDIYTRNLQFFRERFGRVHPETLLRTMNAARAHWYAKQFHLAEPLFREYDSIHVELKRYEGDHHHQMLLQWSKCLAELARYDEAEELIHRCIDYFITMKGNGHANMLEATEQLTELTRKAGPQGLADAWEVVPMTPTLLSPNTTGNHLIDPSGEVHLSASEFRHTSTAMKHRATRWQIRAEHEDYRYSPTLDLSSTENLNELTVPAGLLLPNQTYYCRVAFVGHNRVQSEFSDEQLFRTEQLGYDIRPLDLTSYFNRDVVLSGDDATEDAFADGRHLIIDGYQGDGNHGLPIDGKIGPHRLGNYGEPNAIQFSDLNEEIRVEVPEKFYSAVRFLLATTPLAYRHDDSWILATLEYADGFTETKKVRSSPYAMKEGAPVLMKNMLHANFVRKWIRQTGRDGSFRNHNAALFDSQIPVDSSRQLRAIKIRADASSLLNDSSRVNIFAITSLLPRLTN